MLYGRTGNSAACEYLPGARLENHGGPVQRWGVTAASSAIAVHLLPRWNHGFLVESTRRSSAPRSEGPHLKVFDGVTGAEVRSFFAYNPRSSVPCSWQRSM